MKCQKLFYEKKKNKKKIFQYVACSKILLSMLTRILYFRIQPKNNVIAGFIRISAEQFVYKWKVS